MPRLDARTIRRRLNGQSHTNEHVAEALPSDEEFADFLDQWSRSCTAGSSMRAAFVATIDQFPQFRRPFHGITHLVHFGASLNALDAHEIPAAWRATIQLADATHSPKVLSREAQNIRDRASNKREMRTVLTTARASLSVLSWSPIVIAALLLLASHSARSFMFGSRVGLVLGLVGVGLHSLGRAWMTRLFVQPTESLDIHLIESFATTLSAGYGVAQAVALLPQWSSNDMVQRAADRLPFGLREALHELRGISPDTSSAVDLIESATRDGLPVAETLHEYAGDLRARRSEEYRAHIRAMSVKANIPLVVCVLPSFILLALAPLVAVIMSPLGTAGS